MKLHATLVLHADPGWASEIVSHVVLGNLHSLKQPTEGGSSAAHTEEPLPGGRKADCSFLNWLLFLIWLDCVRLIHPHSRWLYSILS